MSYLLRSNLFVPGYGRKYIESALRRNSDAIILDFEDAVPKELKEDAHKTVVEYISQGRLHDNVTFIRLNELGGQWLEDDLKCDITTDIDGFLLPKVTSAKDILAYEEKIQKLERRMGIEDGWFKFMPMIEGALAVVNIHEIATASKRNIALCFGGEDYLNDIRGVHGKVPKAFDYPRAQIVVAARAAGLQPIDTPFLDFADPKEFIREQTM